MFNFSDDETSWKDEDRPKLRKAEVEVVYQYIQSWSQRSVLETRSNSEDIEEYRFC